MEENEAWFEVVAAYRERKISEIINDCIGHVEKRVLNDDNKPSLLSKLKWVLTEMLTNAIKHSGIDQCTIKIRLEANGLILKKEDAGNPLVLKNGKTDETLSWPIGDGDTLRQFSIYHNGSESLEMNLKENGTAVFCVRELREPKLGHSIEDSSEHFGLLIITKACESFTYEFDNGSRTNLFTSHFKIS